MKKIYEVEEGKEGNVKKGGDLENKILKTGRHMAARGDK